jgi:hypothetical protein
LGSSAGISAAALIVSAYCGSELDELKIGDIMDASINAGKTNFSLYNCVSPGKRASPRSTGGRKA